MILDWWYYKQWKDPTNHSKGTIWTYLKKEAYEHAGIPRLEEGMNCLMGSHRHRECMRGTKWEAPWEDGTKFIMRTSAQATKSLMASITQRWANPPRTFKKEGGQPFEVETLQTRSDSYVYLVRLLTFEETASGAAYFKIGKATSIPSRIKQFGPCELIAHEVLEDGPVALKRENQLHKQLAAFRRPETEIFQLSKANLQQVVDSFKS